MPVKNTAELKLRTAFITSLGIGIFYVVLKHRVRIMKYLNFRNPFRNEKIEIIDNIESCNKILRELKKHTEEYSVVGFDCEWVTIRGQRRHTALLQLASHRGLCALIRLCKLPFVPNSLRDFLQDESIIKVGVVPNIDAANLSHDFEIGVASTLDLRFLALMADKKPQGLGKMAKSILNIELDKNWRISCSDWEAQILTDIQVLYAARDALAAVEIFKNLSKHINPKYFWQTKYDLEIYSKLQPFFDLKFKDGAPSCELQLKRASKKSTSYQIKKQRNERSFSTRSKALYDNCFMEAPDGEKLCTCDYKKAHWYVKQNLAEIVENSPFTIRLNFEPSGRAEGEVGKFYTIPKENQCVVCGKEDSFIRKNVVPREYRKHFPVVMKSHTSHDVVLLCPKCHQISNISDQKIRDKLVILCKAPLAHSEGGHKYIELPKMRELRSAARALFHNSDKIPIERQKVLKQIIRKNYPGLEEITEDILECAANANILESIENYVSHGLKVVNSFQEDLGGLIKLEEMWREHFISTMKPKFLPELWSINHNADRLNIRVTEGRIDKEDIKKAGLQSFDQLVDTVNQ